MIVAGGGGLLGHLTPREMYTPAPTITVPVGRSLPQNAPKMHQNYPNMDPSESQKCFKPLCFPCCFASLASQKGGHFGVTFGPFLGLLPGHVLPALGSPPAGVQIFPQLRELSS